MTLCKARPYNQILIDVLMLVSFFVLANTSKAKTTYGEISGRENEIGVIDVNQVEFYVSNYGIFGKKANYTPGCYWPKGSNQGYIYAGGVWFGTIEEGDTLVTVGYNPLGGHWEFVPGLSTMVVWDPDAILYTYPIHWPPPLSVYPMAPQGITSHQDAWCAFNDLDESAHMPGDTRPIGIEVYLSIYAWNVSSTEDIIYMQYIVKNVGDDDLDDCYIAVCADNDIGRAYDDLASGVLRRCYIINGDTLWIDDLGYQWQWTSETGWLTFPGVIAYDFLQSPYDLEPGQDKDGDGIPDQYERDSAYYVQYLPDSMWDVDGDKTPDWRDPSQIPQLGMTALKRFVAFYEPTKDGERYRIMAGYDFYTGAYQPYDTVTPSTVADQRFVQSSGPFSLAVDSSVTMAVGIMFADWYGIFDTPDSALAEIGYACQFVYDMNWLLPGPPSPPNLICVPGDASITLTWDNLSEVTPDPYYEIASDPASRWYDPFYKPYDFEGYRIWKNPTGQFDDWQLVTSFDMQNNIVFEDTTQPDSIRIYATNTGITHTYVDNNVRNGFEYTYAVTAFDYNYVQYDTIDSMGNPIQIGMPIWYETGRFPKSGVPRRDPANLVPGRCSVYTDYGNPFLLDAIDYSIPYPLDMIDTTVFLSYGNIGFDTVSYGAIYTLYYEDVLDNPIDSTQFVSGNSSVILNYSTVAQYGVVMNIECTIDSISSSASIFDTIIVVTGSYPDSLPKPGLPGPWASYFATWTYRGNNYDIHWISTSGGMTANSVIVIDTTSRDTIQYRPYNPESGHEYDSLANGWCFLSHLSVSDTIVLYGSPPATQNTKYLFINGGLVALKRGGFLQPGDILPNTGDIWVAVVDSAINPAPANAHFSIDMNPAYFDTINKYSLNVKVVPNPFLVHNEWHVSVEAPRIRFINLPADCVIRIFTLNGDLVKTIRHHHTFQVELGQEEVKNDAGGDEWWNLVSETSHDVVSGVYLFHIQSDVGEQVGKFVIIR